MSDIKGLVVGVFVLGFCCGALAVLFVWMQACFSNIAASLMRIKAILDKGSSDAGVGKHESN